MSYRRAEEVENVCRTCGATFRLPKYERASRAGQYCSWACFLGRPTKQRRTAVNPIAEALRAGTESGPEIARRLGVTHQRVYQVAKAIGVQPGVTASGRRRSEILSLLDQGLLVEEIAERTGADKSTVVRVAKQAGKPYWHRRQAFCPRGHDKRVVGVYRIGGREGGKTCRVCHQASVRRWMERARRDPERWDRIQEGQRAAQRRYYAQRRAGVPSKHQVPIPRDAG